MFSAVEKMREKEELNRHFDFPGNHDNTVRFWVGCVMLLS